MKELDVVKIKRHDRELITIELLTIKDDLSDFYEHIECSTIDIVKRRFSGRFFDIICDDEGLLKEKAQYPTSLWFDGTKPIEALVGTLLLCHSDDEGNLTSATFEDLILVHQACICLNTNEGNFMVLEHNL